MCRLNRLANETLTRPLIANRCPLCGCEVLDGASDGTVAHKDCTDLEMACVKFDFPSPFAEDAEIDPDPSTGHGGSSDFEEWVSALDTAFGDRDVGF